MVEESTVISDVEVIATAETTAANKCIRWWMKKFDVCETLWLCCYKYVV